jgi:hypothetical protein
LTFTSLFMCWIIIYILFYRGRALQ